MNTTRNKLIALSNALASAKQKGNNAFKLKIIKNANLIKPEIEALVEIEKQNAEKMKPYQDAVSQLFEQYSEVAVDENGQQSRKIPAAKLEDFNGKYKALIAENKTLIDESNQLTKDYVAMLNDEETEFTFDFHKVETSEAPELTGDELEALLAWEILV
jgi:CO dehydrogenase/acetyl-CoA synthase delta subunit